MSEYPIVTTEPADLLVCSGNTDTIEHIDPSTDTAVTIANTSAIRYGGYSVSSSTYTWLAGGSSTGTSVEKLDNTSYTSAVLASADLVTPIAGGACASSETVGFFIGSTWGDDIFAMDLSTETVSYLTDMPTRVSRASATQDNYYVYCTGGTDTSGTVTGLIQSLEISSTTWTSIDAILGGRSNHSSALKGSSIWVAGGLSNSGLRSDIVALDTSGVSYVGFRSYLSQTRRDFIALANSSYCWWAGGYSPPTPLSLVDRTNLSNDTTDALYRCSLSAGKYSALRAGDFAPVYNILADYDLTCMLSAVETKYKDLRGMIGQSGGLDTLTSSSKAYIIGGQNYTTIYSSIVRLTSADDTEAVVNSSLTPRYSGSTLSNAGYTWYAGGRTSDGLLADVVERLDHSSDTTDVISSTIGYTFAEAGCLSAFNECRVKAGETLYNFDSSTETWSVSACTGTDIFISGSGIDTTGIFGGGITGSIRSDDIVLLDLNTDSLYAVPSNLSTTRYGVSSGSIAETTWFFGGVNMSYTGVVETYNHLSKSAPITSRASLPTAKNKCGIAVFASSLYIIGGYRGYALDEMNHFDPYSDTSSIVSRTSVNIIRHSFGTGTDLSYDNRALASIKCTLNSTISADLTCQIQGIRSGMDLNCTVSALAVTVYAGLEASVSVSPLEYTTVRKAECAPSGVLAESDVSAHLAVVITDTCVCSIPGAVDLASNTLGSLLSSPYSLCRPYISDAPVWAGGSTGINAVEKLDMSTVTWTTRGMSLYPRGGAASATSSDSAWIGGGSTSNNLLEYMSYDNDTLTLDDRSDLSLARSYLVAGSDSNYCWYIGGTSVSGLTGVVDRLDKSNDIATAVYRCLDRPRIKAACDSVGSSLAILGGQVGLDTKDWVSLLSPDNDTLVSASANLAMPLMDHCCIGIDSAKMVVQHGSHIYDFDATIGISTVVNDAPYYTSSQAYRSGDYAVFTGGLNGTIKSARTALYDAVSGTLVNVASMYFVRYYHWMAGPSSPLDNAAMTVRSTYSSVENHVSDIGGILEADTADNAVHAITESADTEYSTVVCGCSTPEGCTYSYLCDYMWVLGAAGNLWRLTYSASYSNIASSVPNYRSCGGSSSTDGYAFGGSRSAITVLNYSSNSYTDLGYSTDSQCESATALSCLSDIKILNGCEYYGEYIPISSKYRVFDKATNALSEVSTALSPLCRTCGIRSYEGVGYILGGTNIQDDLVSSIIVVNTDTDTVSVSTNTLTTPFDLLSSFATSYGTHILTDGQLFDPSTEICTTASIWWPTLYGASCGTESSDALVIGGSTNRVDGSMTGSVVPGLLNRSMYMYDQHSDTLQYAAELAVDIFESPTMYAYEMCSPLITVADDLAVILSACGTRITYVAAEVKKDYTYSDTNCEIQEAVDTCESTLQVIYDAYESSAINCSSASIDTASSAKACLCHYSVINYNSDLTVESLAIDRQYSDLMIIAPAEQLSSTLNAIAYLPNFSTYGTSRNCSLYIGGEISTRRCYINVSSTRWTLEMTVPELVILQKSTESGDLLEILHKLVRDSNSSKTVSEIFSSVSSAFGNENFIYSIDHGRGVKASEGTLILPGSSIQILRLAIRLSGTNMWISNRQGSKFYVSCSRDYVGENGIVYMPISGNIMILSLKLAEPLSTRLTFDFRSSEGTAVMQLMPM